MSFCHICKKQGRNKNLIDFLKLCPLCLNSFCFPHHSANPLIFSETRDWELELSWRDWKNSVSKVKFPAFEFCLLCGLSPQASFLNPLEFLRIQDEILKRKLSKISD